MHRSSCSVLLRSVLFSALLLAGPAMWGQGVFVETDGFATKTGFRGVFVWKATQPVMGVVRYGESPTALTQGVPATRGVADTSRVAVASNLTSANTYYGKVEDSPTGKRSSIKSFEA